VERKNDVRIGGLLIDTLAYNFISQWEYRDKSFMYYDWMSRDCFEYLKKQDPDQTYWKAVGSGQCVWRTGAFENKAKTAYEPVLRLSHLPQMGIYGQQLKNERDLWKQIPSYLVLKNN
jgi:hypothetical protein